MNKTEKYDFISVMKRLLKRIGENSGEYEGMVDYLEVTECASRLLDEVFGKNNYSLPIDMDEVIRKLNIEVVEIDLNSEEHGKRSNRVVGELAVRPQIFGDGEIRRIYIDSKTTLYTQRYALAYELGHYLINDSKKLFSDEYSIMPLLPKKAEELIADAFAISMLIPIKAFIKEFYTYINEERKKGKLPVGTEEWLQYLSTVSRVSFHYVACGYQQLRCVALWLYQYQSDKKKKEDRKIQNKLKDKERSYPVLISDIETVLNAEILDELFQ